MSEYSQQIKRDIDNFQMAVQKLGTGIKAASALWRDPKYSELSSEMTQIANLSKTVLTAGDKSCEAISLLSRSANTPNCRLVDRHECKPFVYVKT